MWHDLVYAARRLRSRPTAASAVILTLAIGLGGTVAVFAVVNAVLFRQLPYPEPDRLAVIWENNERRSAPLTPTSFLNYDDLRRSTRTFEDVGVFTDSFFNLTGEPEPERVPGLRISPRLLGMLQVPPLLGRVFADGEDLPSAPDAVVLGEGFWRRRFAADSSIIGRTIVIDDVPRTVVGVMPATFVLPPAFNATIASLEVRFKQADLWLPVRRDATTMRRDLRFLFMIGRLRAGVTLDQARSELAAIAMQLSSEYPQENYGLQFTVLSLRQQMAGTLRGAMALVFLGAALVLGIACVNATSLLLSSMLHRRREFAIRIALGATRWHLVRQLLAEGLLLGALAGAIATAAAAMIARPLDVFTQANLPRLGDVHVDGTVLLFAAILSAVTALAVSAVPAADAGRLDLGEMLKSGSPGMARGRRGRLLRHAFVTAEIALAVAILSASGTLARAFSRLEHINPGFRAGNVMVVDLYLPQSRYGDVSSRAEFQRRLLEQIPRNPGIRDAATADDVPFGENSTFVPVTIEERPALSPAEQPRTLLRVIAPRYFTVLSIPVRDGRSFTDGDSGEAPRVVIVNEAFAQRFLPASSPIGRRIKRGLPASKNPWLTVVGVAAPVRSTGLSVEPQPEMFQPYAQSGGSGALTLLARGDVEPRQWLPLLRDQVRAIDPGVSLSRVRHMDDLVAESVGRPRLYTRVLAVFALLGLLLATIGVYGVTSFLVGSRAGEIAIRLCLGAPRRSLMKLLVEPSMAGVLAGTLVGAGAALVLTPLMSGLFFGIGPRDWPIVGASATVLLAAGIVASYVASARVVGACHTRTLDELAAGGRVVVDRLR